MVYSFTDFCNYYGDNRDALVGFLSNERKTKVDEIKDNDVKMQSEIAYLLLRYGLKNDFSVKLTADTHFIYENNGKPKLNCEAYPAFSLSHTKNAVACAICQNEVGIDVQTVVSIGEDETKRIFSEKELSVIKSETDKCVFWSAKESYQKNTSNGLKLSMLNKLDFSILQNEAEADLYGKHFLALKFDKYVMCVCTKNKEEIEEIKNITVNDLLESFLPKRREDGI